jgi:drug/metabolite transporter (DMT)-like permease
MRDAGQFRPTFDSASILLLVTALSWAVYAVWGKHLVKGRQPIAMFAVVATFTTIGLAVLSVAFGTPGDILKAGGATTLLMIVSGIVAIGGAHPAFHYAQRHFGSAFTNTFILVTPAMTYAASFVLLPGETLNRTQIIGGAVLISGTLLITITENRQRRRTARSSSSTVIQATETAA